MKSIVSFCSKTRKTNGSRRIISLIYQLINLVTGKMLPRHNKRRLLVVFQHKNTIRTF